jgi:hypothetical protein
MKSFIYQEGNTDNAVSESYRLFEVQQVVLLAACFIALPKLLGIVRIRYERCPQN